MSSDQQEPTIVEKPKAPITVEDTGIPANNLLRLALKAMYVRGMDRISQLSDELKLSQGVCNEVVQEARERKLLETMGLAGDTINSEMRLSLTAQGRGWAADALEQRYMSARLRCRSTPITPRLTASGWSMSTLIEMACAEGSKGW